MEPKVYFHVHKTLPLVLVIRLRPCCHLPRGIFPSVCCSYIVHTFFFLMCMSYTPSFPVFKLPSCQCSVRTQFFKFPIMQFAPSDSSFLLSPNCLFCIHFLSTPVLFPQCQGGKCHTYTKQHAKLLFCTCFNLYVFRQI